MKITPDYESNDSTVRFYEFINENGYFYELYVLMGGKPVVIIVTLDGVSIDFVDGSSVHTTIKPSKIFGKTGLLVWNQLAQILKIIEQTNAAGKFYTDKQNKVLYARWKFWQVVSKCLEEFHNNELIDELRYQINGYEADMKDLFYCNEPFDIACRIAKNKLLLENYLSRYLEIRDKDES